MPLERSCVFVQSFGQSFFTFLSQDGNPLRRHVFQDDMSDFGVSGGYLGLKNDRQLFSHFSRHDSKSLPQFFSMVTEYI